MKKQLAIVHDDSDHSNVTVVDWALGNFCNYECSYCPKSLHDGSSKWAATNQVVTLSEQIIGHYQGLGKKTFFKFTGGEPSLYKGMLTVLQRIKALGAYAAMNSNGSRELG